MNYVQTVLLGKPKIFTFERNYQGKILNIYDTKGKNNIVSLYLCSICGPQKIFFDAKKRKNKICSVMFIEMPIVPKIN